MALSVVAAVLLGLLLRIRFSLSAPDIDVLEFLGVPRKTLLAAAVLDVLAVSGLGALLGVAGMFTLGSGLEGVAGDWVREATGLRPGRLFEPALVDFLLAVSLPAVAVALAAPAAFARLRRPLLLRLRGH